MYNAPEIPTGHYDARVDVWSAGVLLYEIMTKTKFVAGSITETNQVEEIQKLRETLKSQCMYSDTLISIVLDMLIFNYLNRPSSEYFDQYFASKPEYIVKKYRNGTYQGEWRNSKRNGKGTRYWNDGDKYEGDWLDDMATGKGIYYWSNGDRYEGDWLDGKRSGKGIAYCNNGNRYEGDWLDDKRSGKGIYYCSNGDRYEGDYLDDTRSGKGIYYCNNGDRYKGDWLDDTRTGKGIMYLSNGDRYEGDWLDDKRSGKGIYYWSNGDRHEGDYLDDKWSEKGIMYWSNANRYESSYQVDKRHGSGTFVFTTGEKIKLNAISGYLQGNCTVTMPGGETFEVDLTVPIPEWKENEMRWIPENQAKCLNHIGQVNGQNRTCMLS